MVEKEKTVVVDRYKALCGEVFPSIAFGEQILIEKAFRFVCNAYQNVLGASDVAFMTREINVAYIVATEMSENATCIAVALLHNVLVGTDTSLRVLKQHFGEKIARMVDGLTKINNCQVLHNPSKSKVQHKLLKVILRDVEVVVVKIASLLDTLRSIDRLPKTKQFAIASETKEIYAKVANLLGFEKIKHELNDLCLKIIDPERYYMLSSLLEQYAAERKFQAEELLGRIGPCLKTHGIPCSLNVRLKSIASIHQKMSKKEVSFQEIYDLIGIRIIVPDKGGKLNCWRVYGLITSIYRTDRKRTKDWISEPKNTYGYESLHVTVIGVGGSLIEIQIRTERMHEIATKGSAAHWKYKERDLADIFESLDRWSKKIPEMPLYHEKSPAKPLQQQTIL